MPRQNILVVAIDGLRASALGAYGNTAHPTPALDQFAAESFLLDACYAPAADLEDVYRGLWQSRHPLRPATSERESRSLAKLLTERGYVTTLVTDVPELLPGANDFDECFHVAADKFDRRALDPMQTALAGLFAEACAAIETPPSERTAIRDVDDSFRPRLVWIHSRGMYGPWDAPLELQQTLRDEGDPPPLESTAPPERTLAESDSPDIAFQYSCAYSAQVMVLDACWRGLVDTITHATAREPWLVVLIGARGYPLGEHRQIGGADHRLFTEQLHVPWFIRFPNSRGLLARASSLATHLDLLPTLVQWIDESADLPAAAADGFSILPLLTTVRFPWRDALLSAGRSSGSRALRTSSWCLRWDQANESADSTSEAVAAACELFVRPDDRWEANDVAKLCRDVVEELTRAIQHISRQLELDRPLPEQVLSGDDAAPV